MPKKFSLTSSEEEESDSEVAKVKKETNVSFVTNQSTEVSGVKNEDVSKSRTGRVLRCRRIKMQIFSDDSETSANEGGDSDYEPEVSVKAKVGKRKAAAAPKNVKKIKAKQTATKSSPPPLSNLPTKRKSSQASRDKGVRVKRTRWDCPGEENEILPVKKEKEELFGGDDSNDLGGNSRNIKRENVAHEFIDSSGTQIKEESRSNYETEVSGKIKIEKGRSPAASKTGEKYKIKVESVSIKKESEFIKQEIDGASSFSSTSEFNVGYDDIAGTSDDVKTKPVAKWKAELEKTDNHLKRDDKKNVKVHTAEGMKRHEATWEEARVLADDLALEYWIARNIARLLDEDNTIPFIARYRKEMTGNMSPEDLRKVKEAYETLKLVKTKAAALVNAVRKMNKLTPMIENEILSARSMSELEHIKSSFKTAAKGTLADRARELGLETPAVTLLFGNSMEPIRLEQFVCHQKTKGLANCNEVETGLQHIIADIISKDREVQDLVRKLKSTANIYLSCTKSKRVKATDKKSPKSKKSAESKKGKAGPNKKDKEEDENKYQNYFNFKNNVRFIRPHQVLAINRAEKNKILSVKVEAAGHIKSDLFGLVHRQWLNHGLNYPLRSHVVKKSVEDAFERLIFPLLVRLVRSDLTQVAETASVEVFAANLKNLLLQPPFRGKMVVGLDPGFKNGCKLCVISQTGEVLHTDVLYPKFGFRFANLADDPDAARLRWIINSYRCETIALGNGTACRETEEYLSNLIQLGWFRPFDVVYTIVSEQGASIYSCSPEAQKEFPKMDTNLISAVSIARRLQDPLAELVKIEARHLGVGMYQHDISDAKLRSTLDEVVVECVSFVGVDLNAASHCILRKISGLNAARAQNILDWKNANGPFRNREQLKNVKGIGAKSFEQCAGFVRILQQTCFIGSDNFGNKGTSTETKGKKTKAKEICCDLNPLDSTWIHPESYAVAERIVKRCGADVTGIGSPRFIDQVKRAVANIGVKFLSLEMKISEELAKLVTDGLTQRPDHDLRSEFKKPLFRRGVKSLEDLRPGDVLSGIVRNTTHFGAFVDIGVGRDGLLPSARLKYGMSLPQLGDKIEVQIVQVEIERKRITLDLVLQN